ncbi:MAG: Bro-N domain-containing protein [Clostridia bacterium]|nr:Bro-N domain-containing protein [Clostridia bacterium]
MDNKIQIFEDKRIRTAWNEEKEEWYFSVSDVVEILTDSKDVKQYIKKMRSRDVELNSKWGTISTPVEMIALDGKKRKIQAADVAGILRIIQSIPSPKAEPFKMWLAEVGKERIDETIDPELAIDRAFELYQKKGYSTEWIQQRLLSIRVRNNLTDEWDKHGVQKGVEYAILTDEITKAWSGMTTRKYKNLKGLTKENLRDNMSDLELVLNMLAEATTTELSKAHNPQTFEENREIAKRGGKYAGNARKEIEADTGKPVITSKNAAELNQVVVDLIEGFAEEKE